MERDRSTPEEALDALDTCARMLDVRLVFIATAVVRIAAPSKPG